MLKRLRFFIIICILVSLFLPGFAKFQELRQKLADTEDLIQKTQKDNYLLEQRIAQLKNDPHYLEIVAREKMGVVKKGETVLRIVHEGEEGNVTAPSFNTTNNQSKQ